MLAVLQYIGYIVRHGNRTSMCDDDNVLAYLSCGFAPFVYQFDGLFKRFGRSRPDFPPNRYTHVGHNEICASLGHFYGFIGAENIWRGQEVKFMGLTNHVDFCREIDSCFFKALAKGAVDDSNGGEILDASETKFLDAFEEHGHHNERVRAIDPGQYGCVLDYRKHFASHLQYDFVRISIGKQAGR